MVVIFYDPEKISSLEHPNPSKHTTAIYSSHIDATSKAIDLFEQVLAATKFNNERQTVEHGQDIEDLFWWKVSDRLAPTYMQAMVKVTKTKLQPSKVSMPREWVQPCIESTRTTRGAASKIRDEEDTKEEKDTGCVAFEEVVVLPRRVTKEASTDRMKSKVEVGRPSSQQAKSFPRRVPKETLPSTSHPK